MVFLFLLKPFFSRAHVGCLTGGLIEILSAGFAYTFFFYSFMAGAKETIGFRTILAMVF
jgi:hypothetical protein